LSTDSAFNAIPHEIWLGTIAAELHLADIVKMRQVSKAFLTLFSDDDLWLERLTLLALQHPVLSDLDKGEDESPYTWYWRCHGAVIDGRALANRHMAEDQPYLKLYGIVNGAAFTPFVALRFPVPRGFIAELMALKALAGSTDPAFDAVLCFIGAPPNYDFAFRYIFKIVALATRRDSNNPDKLPDILSSLYTPRTASTVAPDSTALATEEG